MYIWQDGASWVLSQTICKTCQHMLEPRAVIPSVWMGLAPFAPPQLPCKAVLSHR